jgi:peptidoglycan/xylan/chitin deacetylase (PgdA/CDA1 family)
MMQYTKQYSEFSALQPRSVRSALRYAALSALDLKGRLLSGNDAALRVPRVQMLFLHHIFEDEMEPFDRLLRELAQTHVFVSHSEAVRRILAGEHTEPCISFSSDDGLKNNLHAAEILERYGATACFYINPNSIGLSEPQQVAAFCRTRLEFPPAEFLDWNDVNALQARGHEIGAHTMDHINVAQTPIEAFREDLGLSRQVLLERCGVARHFAYPYGRYFHFSAAAMAEVFQAGFESCASAERGCHTSEAPVVRDRLLLRRDQIVAGWPLAHNMYFIRRHARLRHLASDEWPV